MKNMYIPEIGDTVVLAKDWSFLLYKEYRNNSLFDHNDGDNHSFVKTREERIRKLYVYLNEFENKHQERIDVVVPRGYNYPPYTYQRMGYKNPEHEEYDLKIRTVISNHNRPFIPVTLPAGTVLKVDRIYIRKGMKDFSSLTFTAKLANMKKAARFWVKLRDVNRMVIE